MKTFPHGLHIPDYKELTSQKPLETMPLPQKVVIPLSQHIGAPASICVEVGQTVLTGQTIGKSGGFVSVDIHSSISGVVREIKPSLHPLGRQVQSVVIESDGQDKWSPDIKPGKNVGKLKSAEICKILQSRGIVGLGGATFPSHVKLTPPPDKKIEYLILNGVECEPFLTADHRLMLEKPDQILAGLDILIQALGVAKAFIGIENNKPDAILLLTEKTQNNVNIEVVPLDLKYPQGAEKQLIKAILDREVPSGGLPLDVGVVVNNVGTAYAVADAVLENRPLIERVVTVTGAGVNNPRNLRVRIGTCFEEVLNFCGGVKDDAAKILMGGPMMGMAQYSMNVPVIKGTSGILALPTDQARFAREATCLRCGSCIDVCPMFINPSLNGLYARFKEFDNSDRANVLDCIECGCCSYVCPAKIPLVHLIRYAKGEVLAKRRKSA